MRSVAAIVLGTLLTFLFTAANAYFGLRVGLTFSTAIPAAVISMAVLRTLGGSNMVENNIVQTIGSAAGAVATMVFVLPGLGSYLLSAVNNRDLPIVQSIAMILVAIVLLINVLVDIAYLIIDPRLRARGEVTA